LVLNSFAALLPVPSASKTMILDFFESMALPVAMGTILGWEN
jgi:hypothetical protein